MYFFLRRRPTGGHGGKPRLMEKDENIISATSARTARGSLATRKDEEYIGDYIREREREREKETE